VPFLVLFWYCFFCEGAKAGQILGKKYANSKAIKTMSFYANNPTIDAFKVVSILIDVYYNFEHLNIILAFLVVMVV
jgi:hypothetical protein